MTTDNPFLAHRPGRKTERTHHREKPTLAAPVVVAEEKKNRGGDVWRVCLQTFENVNLIDVRTYYSDAGYRKPGKGFCAHVRHLPRLAQAINKALDEARNLGLLDAD